MSARGAPGRAVTIGAGIAAVGGLAAALTLYAASFTATDWIVAACAAAAIGFVAANAVPVRGLRLRRTGLAPEAIVLDLPIAVPLIALGGSAGITAAALAIAAGFGAASLVRGARRVTDLARHGALRTIAVLAVLPFAGALQPLQASPLEQSTPIFVLLLLGAAAVYGFGISAPSAAYTFRISVLRVWGRVLRDPRSWLVTVFGAGWAALVRAEALTHHPVLMVSLWVAPAACAVLLRMLDRQHAELHRLRLVRDAVQAMLGERDPLPQINAILATLRVPSLDETVSVLAATGARTDNWRTVTTIGPPLTPAGDELRRRLLARLKFGPNGTTTTLRDEFYTSYGFAVRVGDGDLHGALIVHRRNDRQLSHEQIAQFTNAAFELAPLLRDMRTIAATQSAATIDALTGLANRAAAMDRLQIMLDDLSVAERGAVLLLDIDHFKTINDQLGHAAGDECLRKIGEIIRGTVRGGDTAGRIGGEEFLIVMPGASRDIAMTVGERLRLAIALGGMRYASGEPVTTSIGAAAAHASDTTESLLARADRGLYEAKRQGRNRIVEELESA
jgi:diguanylate cyclase (GGDEF)-like protein